MSRKTSYFTKALSVFLSVLMCLSVCMTDWSVILGKAYAATLNTTTAVNKQYDTEYYSAETTYVTAIGIATTGGGCDGDVDIAKKKLTDNGCTVINENLNATGDGKTDKTIIFAGYKKSNDISHAIRDIRARVLDKDASGDHTPAQIITRTVDGKTVNYYLVGSSEAQNPTGEGSVDLNSGAGGAWIHLYVSYDPILGAPLTSVSAALNSELSEEYVCGFVGYLDGEGKTNMNRQYGDGNDPYMYFNRIPSQTVDSTSLRDVYGIAVDCYNNKTRYTSVTAEALVDPINTATAILAELNASAVTHTDQSGIDSAAAALSAAIAGLKTTVTLNASTNGGTINGEASTTVEVTVGGAQQIAFDFSSYVPEKEGWTFVGWADASTDTTGKKSTKNIDFTKRTQYAIFSREISNTYYYAVMKNGKLYPENGKLIKKNTAYGTASAINVDVPANGEIPLANRTYTLNGKTYEFKGWLPEGTLEHQINSGTVLGSTVNVTTDSDAHKFYARYDLASTEMYADFKYYKNGSIGSYDSIAKTTSAAAGSATAVFAVPKTDEVTAAGALYWEYKGIKSILKGWSVTAGAENPDSNLILDNTDKTISYSVPDGDDNLIHKELYPVYGEYSRVVTANFKYTDANGRQAYKAVSVDAFGGVGSSVDIPAPLKADVAESYKSKGITYTLRGWKVDGSTVVFGNNAAVTVPGDSTYVYEFEPVYEITDIELYARFVYYAANGAYTTKDVTYHSNADMTDTDTMSFNLLTAADTASSYTKDGRTYTLVGWTKVSGSTDGMKAPGASDSFYKAANTTPVTYYAVYKSTTTAKFNYYEAGGAVGTITVPAENYDFDSLTEIGIPSEFNKSFTLDGRTFTFCGWRTDTASAAPALVDDTAVSLKIRDAAYEYYAVYKSDDLTLSYNLCGGSGSLPVSQKGTQYITAAQTANIGNASSVTFTVNPDRVQPTGTGAFVCTGWQYANNSDNHTPEIAFSGATVTVNKNTTLYAVYTDDVCAVNFVYYKDGDFTTLTSYLKRGEASGILGAVTSPAIDKNVSSHHDNNKHYYLSGWLVVNGEGNATVTVDPATLVATVSAASNNAPVTVQALYTGYDHHWEITKVYKTATCENAGLDDRICTVCGCYAHNYETPSLDHIMVYEGYKPATCTEDGQCATATCTNCGMLIEGWYIYNAETKEYTVTSKYPDGVIPMLGHKFIKSEEDPSADKIFDDKPSTCTKAGYTYNKCSVCDEEVIVEVLPIAEHKWKTFEGKAATCTEDGITDYEQCEKCKALKSSPAIIPATGHTITKTPAKAATCTEVGNKEYYSCSVCGKIYKDKYCTSSYDSIDVTVIPALGHDIASHEEIPATCTESGWSAGTSCTRCGYVPEGSAPVTEIPALGHDIEYSEEKEFKATCTEDGYKYKICARCNNEVVLETIEALDHDYSVDNTEVPATCTTDGHSGGGKCSRCGKLKPETLIYPALGHSYSETKDEDLSVAPTCTEAGKDVFVCTREGCTETIEGHIKEVEVPATGHKWSKWTMTNPTCTEDGKKVRVCTVDGCEGKEEIVLPALGHIMYEVLEDIAPTCTGKGYKQGHYCAVCEFTEDGEITSALGHAAEAHAAQAATCTEDGVKAYWYCAQCDKYFEDEALEKETALAALKDGDKLGHDLKLDETATVKPTCTKEGSETYVCSRCDYSEDKVLEKLAHEWNDGEETTKPTCTETGVKTYTCKNCPETKTEEIEALGHEYEAKVTTPATCTENGVKTFTCTREGCTYSYTEDIPALGHVLDHIERVEATCGKAGNIEYWYCVNCNKYFDGNDNEISEEDITIPMPADHNWVNSGDAVPPTCETEGYQLQECSICHETQKTEIVAALSHAWDEGEIKTQPTCTQTGEIEYTCTRADCSATKTEIIVANGHKMERVLYKAPTCEIAGNEDYWKCTVCEKCYSDKFGFEEIVESSTVIPALGHDWEDFEEKAATCTEPAYTSGQKCKHCDAVKDGTVVEGSEALGHDWSMEGTEKEVFTEESTCTVKGYTYYKCNRCGETEIIKVLPLAAHTWEITEAAVEATCSAEGKTAAKECSVCGQTLPAQTTGKKAHTPVLVPAVAATCTEDGHTAYTVCSECEANITYPSIIAKGHKTVKVEAVEATCTEAGSIEYWYCEVCGKLFRDEALETEIEEADIAVEAKGHNAEPGHTEALQPTCTTDGNIEYWYCPDCGKYFSDAEMTVEVETVTLEAAGHSWTKNEVESYAPTCTEYGLDKYYCSNDGCTEVKEEAIEAKGHTLVLDDESYKAATCTEKGYEKYVCSDCEYFEVNEPAALGHKAGAWVTTKQPTCTEKGEKVRYCKVCKEVAVTAEVPATGHSYVKVAAKEATCVADGNIEYFKCAKCGKLFVEEESVKVETTSADVKTDKKGHNYTDVEIDVVVAATCTTKGYGTLSCKVCGAKKFVSIDLIPHTSVDVAAVEPTCTKTGLSAGKKCCECGYIIEAQTIVPAKGHTVDETSAVPEVPATCTENGTAASTVCSECGEVISGGEVLPATGHKFGAYANYGEVGYQAPTCTENGYRTAYCAKCDETLTKVIPMLGHNIVVDKAVAPTCQKSGLTEGCHCTRPDCDYKVEQETVSSLEHNYKSDIVAPTCTRQGYTNHICEYCGDTYKDNLKNALGHKYGSWTNIEGTTKHTRVCSECGATQKANCEFSSAVTLAPTCTNTGVKTFSCVDCGYSYTEPLPVVPDAHSLSDEYIIVKEPGCTEDGEVMFKCIYCDYTETVFVEAFGHKDTDKDGFCDTCLTELEPGSNPGTDEPETHDPEKCELCGMNHTKEGGLFGHNGFLCKLIQFFNKIFSIFK